MTRWDGTNASSTMMSLLPVPRNPETNQVKFVNVTGGDEGGQYVQFKGYGMPRALLEQYQPHGNVDAHEV